MKPLLSIVIANYNYGRFLEDAILSVISQDMGDQIELIICDGGSTDNSVELIKKYEKHISWWCSEKDEGQSAAFNKGFSHAQGRFLTWLNADDVLLPGVLKSLVRAIERFPTCEWFVGGCFWLDPDMHIVNCGRGRSFSRIRFSCGDASVWGPSSFFTKRLFDSVSGIDERFNFAMDTDLWLRFVYNGNAEYRQFCKYAWGLRLHPEAKMSGHNFTANGVLDTEHVDVERLMTNRHFTQIQKEAQWISMYSHNKKLSMLKRVVSVRWWQVLMAKVDLIRFRGKSYLEYYR